LLPVFIVENLNLTYSLKRFHSIGSAITPTHVQQLLSEFGGPASHQLQNVYVQPSQRIFPDGQYEAAGATITESLEGADILLGVKVRLFLNDDILSTHKH
jgi:hypothetical protein